MKKIVVTSVVVIMCVIAIVFLWANRFWPFATGSNIPAFLGTTFEMSLQEVQRTLKKNSTQLIDAQELKTQYPEMSKKLLIYYFDFMLSKDKKIKSLYMKPIEMFESNVVAEFTFKEDKLSSIEIGFRPFRDLLSKEDKHAAYVVEQVINALKAKYKLLKSEPSKVSEGGYSLIFERKNVRLNMWVNLIDQANPNISITMVYNPLIIKSENELKDRQANAF